MVLPPPAVGWKARLQLTAPQPDFLPRRTGRKCKIETLSAVLGEHWFNGLVIRLLLHLRVLQPSLRDRLAQAGDGAIRRHQRPGFDCAVHIYGWLGTRIVGERTAHSAARKQDRLSRLADLRSHRACDWRFSYRGAA